MPPAPVHEPAPRLALQPSQLLSHLNPPHSRAARIARQTARWMVPELRGLAVDRRPRSSNLDLDDLFDAFWHDLYDVKLQGLVFH